VGPSYLPTPLENDVENPNSIIGESETVPVADLLPYHDNPRIGNVEKIIGSLTHNFQYRALVVNRRTNEVLAGNHTLQAAKALGWEYVDVAWVDADEDHARRIVLADNSTSDDGTYNDLLLAAILGEMREEDEMLLEGTGYTTEDVDEMLANALLFEPDEDDEEHVSSIGAMLNRIMPLSTEEQIEVDARNQQKLIEAASRAAELKSNADRPSAKPTEYVIFQFGELRAKVLKTTYDEFMKWYLPENGGNLSEAGVAAALKLGFGKADVQPGVSEGVERWL